MQAMTAISPLTMTELGIPTDAQLHSVREADQLGIEISGPEHDDVDALDFVEVPHD